MKEVNELTIKQKIISLITIITTISIIIILIILCFTIMETEIREQNLCCNEEYGEGNWYFKEITGTEEAYNITKCKQLIDENKNG